jgi:hypothetical protein
MFKTKEQKYLFQNVFLKKITIIIFPPHYFSKLFSAKQLLMMEVFQLGPVTKIENIKTDATKILRPTHFGE